MDYLEYEDFRTSVQSLYRKGGKFQKAANQVLAMRGMAFDGCDLETVFTAPLTNHGESRLPHARKYDLTGFSRLVTVVNNDICMFLFAGTHDDVDHWLERNTGVDFVAKQQGGKRVVEPVFVSSAPTHKQLIRTGVDLGAPEKLVQLLPERYLQKLLADLPEEFSTRVCNVGPMDTDDELIQISEALGNTGQSLAILDVLLKLRESDANGAKNRIDLYLGEAKQLNQLSAQEKAEISSGEKIVKVADVDPNLFEHFVKTASYQKWMLYLHPSQREYVDANYAGTVRLSGVSGSGKTCVLIHRAIRLARLYPDQKILLLTLNAALAALIRSLVAQSVGPQAIENLEVTSFWEVCLRKILCFEPHNRKIYTPATIATNPYAVSQHIDELWEEFYNCENNHRDAELMYPLHRSLLARRVYPKAYIRQEFDYIRSAFPPALRDGYAVMERKGRAVPLDKSFRKQVIDGLGAWERQMNFVGAVDPIAIASALHKYLDKIEPEYRAVLVDEVQDFGTVELSIIRRLVAEGENDLFLCGDTAQSVFTKSQDLEQANVNVRGARSMRLQQNYRNSRQILAAAYDVLVENYDRRSKGIVDLEILSPEFANFSSAAPGLLEAETLEDELDYALSYARAVVDEAPHKKVCISFCGYVQRSVEQIGERLSLPVLNGDIDILSDRIFLSDLEQTKGFEFDTMIIVNAHAGVLPHPDLPEEESFRDLSKLYVAMTRAKTELIVSYHGRVTDFIGEKTALFAVAAWSDYSEKSGLPVDWHIPNAEVTEKIIKTDWLITAAEFLRLPEAIGLAINVQEKLLERVTGKVTFEGKQRKQKTWKTVGDFLSDMHQPKNRTAVHLSEEAWHALANHFGRRRILKMNLN